MDALSLVRKYDTKRVLVIDDEEFCITTLQILMKQSGIDTANQVDFVMSGQEALDKVVEASDLGHFYSLILTDFSMPMMDGIEATSKIVAFLSSINAPRHPTIIGLTGHT